MPSEIPKPKRPLVDLDAGAPAKPKVTVTPIRSRPIEGKPDAAKDADDTARRVPSRPIPASGDAKPTPPASTSPPAPRKPATPPGTPKQTIRGKIPPISQLKGRNLGRILIKMGKITRTQAAEAKEVQAKQGGPIGQILVELGYADEADIQIALAAQVGMEPIDLSKLDLTPEIIAMVPAQVAHTYKIIPTDWQPETKLLSIALASPDNFQATDDLKTLMGFNIKAYISSNEQIESMLGRYYPEDAVESIH
ncbi:MAG: hypothetical protein JXA69_13130, partial [Phycisphaerae bacterium]|nr:hypothetical protein [Phycisphaerae bacterium]